MGVVAEKRRSGKCRLGPYRPLAEDLFGGIVSYQCRRPEASRKRAFVRTSSRYGTAPLRR